jgi:phospholipase/lecithinase/hemolysin
MKKMNARPILSWLTLGLVAIALSGCGGGEQARKFRPTKIVSFGDESSAFTQEAVGAGTIKGLKYTVNDLEVSPPIGLAALLPTGATFLISDYPAYPSPATVGVAPEVEASTIFDLDVVALSWNMTALYIASGDTASDPRSSQPNTNVKYQYAYNCGDTSLSAANRLWIQVLANAYGLSYASDCPGNDIGGAITYAAAGDRSAQTIVKINNNLGNVDSATLATVLAGQHDVLDQYKALYDVATEPTEAAILAAEANLKGLGQQLGQAVNGLAFRGAKVLLSTLPDLSYSPRVQYNPDNTTPRTDATLRAAVMRRLVIAFNAGMFSDNGVRGDGHAIVVVKAFELTRDMSRSPTSFGLINGTQAVCDVNALRRIDATATVAATNTSSDLKYCNDLTLVAGSTSTAPTSYNYLWALDTWLSPAGHASLGNLAYQRADGDTF